MEMIESVLEFWDDGPSGRTIILRAEFAQWPSSNGQREWKVSCPPLIYGGNRDPGPLTLRERGDVEALAEKLLPFCKKVLTAQANLISAADDLHETWTSAVAAFVTAAALKR